MAIQVHRAFNPLIPPDCCWQDLLVGSMSGIAIMKGFVAVQDDNAVLVQKAGIEPALSVPNTDAPPWGIFACEHQRGNRERNWRIVGSR